MARLVSAESRVEANPHAFCKTTEGGGRKSTLRDFRHHCTQVGIASRSFLEYHEAE